MIDFRGVMTPDVAAWWPKVAGWIEAAQAHGPGLYAADDIRAEVEARDMQMWVVCDDNEPVGVAITSVVVFPRKTLLIIRLLGGVDAKTWICGLDDHLRDYAAAMGCDLQFSEGRSGWDRFVGNGWTATSTQYIREVSR